MQLQSNNPQQGLSPLLFHTNYRNAVSKKDTQVSRCINNPSAYYPAVCNKSSAQAKTKKETKENKGSIESQLFALQAIAQRHSKAQKMPDMIAGLEQSPAQDVGSQKCDIAVICMTASLCSCKRARLFLKPVPGRKTHKMHILPHRLTIWCITKL